MVFLQSLTQLYVVKKFPGSPNRRQTCVLPVTSPDVSAKPMSYRRLVAQPLTKETPLPFYHLFTGLKHTITLLSLST